MATKKKSASKTYLIKLSVRAIIEREVLADSLRDAIDIAESAMNDNPFNGEWECIDSRTTVAGADSLDDWNVAE